VSDRTLAVDELAPVDEPGPLRVPPAINPLNEEFWLGGFSGLLRIQRCDDCRTWNHPATTVCRSCLSRNVQYESATGRASVVSFTINHHQWSPSATSEPYVVALVELDEQAGLRLVTNILDCPPTEVFIGMRVEVEFRRLQDVALPLFRPVVTP
jgi:uncharacterized OB-fold protein